jgi:hypothetical protein
MKEFETKRGTLTAYAFACGYIQRHYESNNGVTLGGNGGGSFYPYYVTVTDSSGIVSHECYETLLLARRAYAYAVKQLSKTVAA